MTTLRDVRMLTSYMAWANDRIFDAVAALPAFRSRFRFAFIADAPRPGMRDQPF